MVAKRVLAVAQRARSAARSTARRVSGFSADSPTTGGTPARTTAKKATAKKTSAAKAAPGTAPATTPARKAPAQQGRATAAKKTPATAAKKTPATAAKKTPATAAKKTPATAAKKTAPGTTTTTTKKAAPATTMTASKKTTPATKAAPARKAAGGVRGAAQASSLAVLEHEEPWTAAELKGVRAEIEADIERLVQELRTAENELVDLMRDSGDGAGDDQADAGAKTYEREQEISLANNAREMLDQNQRALERLDNGTYGTCESCGNPVGKLRLQAAPRATLCMPCKTKEERR